MPCFNNEATIGAAVNSVRQQTIAPAFVVVVDDGSTDDSANVAADAGARVIRHGRNLGRGAARASGMTACDTDFVVCCDATNLLAPDFIAGALPWFNDDRVAAVYGRIRNATTITSADRWRARYLFREQDSMAVVRRASLITGGTIVRRSSVEDAGGYYLYLRHSEDRDLGERLLKRDHDVVFDPMLRVYAAAGNSTAELLERFWRWQAGVAESADLNAYVKHTWFAWRHMVLRDVRSRDVGMAFISALAPHYCYWRSRIRLWASAVQRRSDC